MRVVNVYFSATDSRVQIPVTADVDFLGVGFGTVVVSKDPSLTYSGFFAKADNSYDNDIAVASFLYGGKIRFYEGDLIYAVGGGSGATQLWFEDPVVDVSAQPA